MITAASLRNELSYDARTGVFTRRRNGLVAGGRVGNGYILIHVQGRQYLAHRLAWLYAYGHWPKNLLDHKNRKKDDNRLRNLREATKSQNGANRSPVRVSATGARCVYRQTNTKKWRVRVSNAHIGYFVTKRQALAAANAALLVRHGEFANVASVLAASQ